MWILSGKTQYVLAALTMSNPRTRKPTADARDADPKGTLKNAPVSVAEEAYAVCKVVTGSSPSTKKHIRDHLTT